MGELFIIVLLIIKSKYNNDHGRRVGCSLSCWPPIYHVHYYTYFDEHIYMIATTTAAATTTTTNTTTNTTNTTTNTTNTAAFDDGRVAIIIIFIVILINIHKPLPKVLLLLLLGEQLSLSLS